MVRMERTEGDASAGLSTSEGVVSIVRTRLTDSAWREPILLIEAPAGYGKSTLAQQIFKSSPRGTKAIALSLKAEHRNPGVLLAELIDLLSRGKGKPTAASSDPADLFLRLTKKIENSSQRLRLIFDDVHHLAGSPAMAYLSRLLGGAGPNLQFVMTSREFRDPQLAITDLSAKGMVRWIGPEALAMTEGEALDLAKMRAVRWQPEQVQTLVKTIQGWPVLLQLALSGAPSALDQSRLAMTDAAPVRRYIEDRFLSGLTRPQHQLLAVMSFDDAIPVEMLNTLDIVVPKDALDSLERLGILQRLRMNTGQEALSIHPVLRDSVLRSASVETLTQLNQLRRSGAHWWHEHNDVRRAVQLMVDAGDGLQAAEWLQEISERMVFQAGWHQTYLDLLELCQPLPPHLKDHLEELAVWALIFQRRHVEAEQRLKRTRSVTEAASGVVLLQRGVIAGMRDDHRSAAAFAGEWLRNHHGDDYQQGVARVVVAFEQKCECQFDEASRNLSLARGLFANIRSDYGLAWAHVVSLLTLLKAGRHRQARAEIFTSLKSISGEDWASSQRAMLLGIQALLHYERDELAEARAALEDCLPLLPDQGLADAVICGYITAARLRCAEGDLGTALDLLAEGEHIGAQRGFPRLSKAIASERVLSLLRAGAIDQAESTAHLADLRPDSNAPFAKDRGVRLFTRLALLRGEARQAASLIAPMVAHARNSAQQFKLCECLLLKAVANYDLGNTPRALEQIHEALKLGELEGYFRVYYDEYTLLAPLLETYQSEYRGRCSPLAQKIREKASPSHAENTLDALSERELQIIKLLSEGLSNAEIANRCFLGEGTVKWYLHNIYGKLDVGSRMAAVHAAQRAGLI
ncbi:hypothetical protein E4T66_13930 [Sinimarinibacterium sp. CAU 1509]|nr:hypothetical protein E4T66_13930 [Sinimarinibacterium sp. CAU 1509]